MRTNALDYPPGALVLVMGDGWQPDERVELFVNDDEGKSWSTTQEVIADADGAFVTSFRLPAWFVAEYTIIATGELSGQAAWHFTDAIGTGATTTGNSGEPKRSEVTIARPVTAPGRLLLAHLTAVDLNNGRVFCAPSGWSSPSGFRIEYGHVTTQTFYKVASASEPASYTWRMVETQAECTSSNPKTQDRAATGAITSYSGIDTTSPIRALASNAGSGTALLAPAVTGAVAGDTVVRHFGSEKAAPISTASASSTGVPNSQVYSFNRDSNKEPAIAAADADQPGDGSTGTLAASSVENKNWAAQTVVLRKLPPTLTLSIVDPTAQFGSNLTPDGEASNSTDTVSVHLDSGAPSAGACYDWAGSVSVASSTGYRVMVTASAANARLDLVNASPADYSACTSGEPVGPNMYPGATPAGTWRSGQTATSGRTHPLGLGLQVPWLDSPSATLGDAKLTFTAIAE